jgi:hypothetical protein
LTSESLKKPLVYSKYESYHNEEDSKQAKDFIGIEGSDRVDRTASALLKAERFLLTKMLSENIKSCMNLCHNITKNKSCTPER